MSHGSKQRIGFDARALESGSITGIGNYTLQVARAAEEVGFEAVFFANKSVGKETEAIAPGRNQYHWEQVVLRRLLREHPVDLYHATANHGIPKGYRGKTVLTVHDVIPLALPELYRPTSAIEFADRLAYRWSLWQSIRSAKTVLTGSRASAQDILARYPFAKEKLQVTYYGSELAAEKPHVQLLFDLPAKFVVYFGGFERRKNVENLVKAMKIVRAQHPDVQLVLIGKKNAYFQEHIQPLVDADTLCTDYISDVELQRVVHRATAFVYPSLYEGFGLPIVEAMQLGVPIVCGNTGAIAEVAGDAALVADVRSADEIAVAIKRVFTDPDLSKALVQKGMERSQQFTWKEMRDKTAAIYRELVN